MPRDEHIPSADDDDRKVWCAVNYFDECREIVRRLAECHETGGSPILIMIESARLWAKMKEEVGDGE